jgi:microsomal prostaglandin-E synthase 2
MVLNTNRTWSEAAQGYKYVDKIYSFNFLDRLILKVSGGPIMYMVAQKVTKPKLMKAGYDGQDPRPPLYEKINHWVHDGLKGKTFHGGNQPDLADLDIYGIIQSQRFLPVFDDMIRNTDPVFSEWINNMDALMPARYKL